MAKVKFEAELTQKQFEKFSEFLKWLKRDNEHISLNDGVCWFCHKKTDDIVFDVEFDTYIHIEYIKKALRDNPNNRETKLMKYLINK